ncbi:Aldehyde/histidinol dehydrogenase [Dichotomocladium elegans]|nr:Aldehyde/histidinol dehydrogenase [Dichotomocladium elegans]
MSLQYASPDVIAARAKEVRQTYLSGVTRPLKFRKDVLKDLVQFLDEQKDALAQAVYSDMHRPKFETLLCDLGVVKQECKYMLKNMDRLAATEYPDAGWFSKGNAMIRKEPKGVVLVIGSWNYSIHTSLLPAIAALAAGNTVIIKPSEMAPHVARVLAEKLHQYVDPKVMCVLQGGPEETILMMDQDLDHIFYTGNGAVGRTVMTAAAKQLATVTLELGGKSPAIILPDADLDSAAGRICWGKFMNAGQTCIAPDFVVATELNADKFIEKLKETIVRRYGVDPQKSDSFARIINRRHFERISELLRSVPAKSIVHGGNSDPDTNYVDPTLIRLEDTKDIKLMENEIFGPLLPIIVVPNVEAIVPLLKNRDIPLALYIFGEKKSQINDLLDQLPSGGACINNVLLHASHPRMPFGGQGKSGMGAYHGDFGFNEFTHRRSTLYTPSKASSFEKIITAPYTAAKITFVSITLFGVPGNGFKSFYNAISAFWKIMTTKDAVGHAKID